MSDRSVWIAPNLMQPCSLCQKWGLIPVLTCQPASRHIRWRFLQLGILSGSKEEIKITPAFDSFKHRINLKVRKAMAVLEEVLNTTFCNLYLWWKNTSLRMHVIYVKVHDCLLVEPKWQTLKCHPCSPLSHSFLVGKIWMKGNGGITPWGKLTNSQSSMRSRPSITLATTPWYRTWDFITFFLDGTTRGLTGAFVIEGATCKDNQWRIES